MHSVVLTSTFERNAQDAGLAEDDILEIVSWLARNAMAGDLIVGTGGARKTRFARKGAGKSGGYRTVHYYAGPDTPVFLLALIDKGERANLSQAERNDLARLLPQIAASYRAGVSKRIVKRRRR